MTLNFRLRSLSVVGMSLAAGSLTLALLCLPVAAQTTSPSAPPPGPLDGAVVTPPPPPASSGPRMVGGHIGVAVPMVVLHFNKSTGAKTTTSISDQVTIAHPIGISVHLSSDWVFDFETIVANNVKPWGGAGLTVDPGLVNVGGSVAYGLRVKFDVSPAGPANFGVIPLVNKGLVAVGGGMWFIEGALPITATKGVDLSVGLVIHTGVGF